MFKFKKYLFILTVGCICLIYNSPAIASNFEKGKSAYLTRAWNLAVSELRPLAEQGHTEAQLLMANMYSDGTGVKQNHEKAKELYEISAHKGNNNAMLALATIYSEGVNTDKDLPKGAFWFTKSAEWGNQVAQFTIASLLTDGDPESGIPIDKVASYKWFRIASNVDDIPRITKASKGFLELLVEELTPAQIEKVEKEIKFWRPKEGIVEEYVAKP